MKRGNSTNVGTYGSLMDSRTKRENINQINAQLNTSPTQNSSFNANINVQHGNNSPINTNFDAGHRVDPNRSVFENRIDRVV